MPTFGNPVVGYIRPKGSAAIVGSFRVTATFADHMARVPPTQGVDIGDGQCGAPVFAMHDGRVTLAGLLGSAKVVRIMALDGIHETGYAHLASIGATVKVGVNVKRGQQIGTLGATGTTACHLHLGCKVNGVEKDVWPMLEQVQEETKHVAGLTAKIAAAKKALG